MTLPPLATADDLEIFCRQIVAALKMPPSPLSNPGRAATFLLADRRWGTVPKPNPFFTSQAFFEMWEALVEAHDPGRGAGLPLEQQAPPSQAERDWLIQMSAKYPPVVEESPSIRSVPGWAELMALCRNDDLDNDVQVSENRFLRVNIWQKREKHAAHPRIGMPIIPKGPPVPWECTATLPLRVGLQQAVLLAA